VKEIAEEKENWLLYIPHSLYKEAKEIAKKLGYPSFSSFIREAIREQFDKEKPLDKIPKSKFKFLLFVVPKKFTTKLKKTTAFLQVLKDTGARGCEASKLKWMDIDEKNVQYE
jgi:metal-responsive CopG/Arc/MetJ family transcriptional regulator